MCLFGCPLLYLNNVLLTTQQSTSIEEGQSQPQSSRVEDQEPKSGSHPVGSEPTGFGGANERNQVPSLNLVSPLCQCMMASKMAPTQCPSELGITEFAQLSSSAPDRCPSYAPTVLFLLKLQLIMGAPALDGCRRPSAEESFLDLRFTRSPEIRSKSARH